MGISSYRVHTALCRNVRNVYRHLRILCYGKLSCRDYILAQPAHTLYAELLRDLSLVDYTAVYYLKILAVRNDLQSGIVSLYHCLRHHIRRFNGSAVVAHRNTACRLKFVIVAQFLALHTLCDTADRINLRLCFLCLVENIFYRFLVVNGRFRVRHTRKRRNTACDSRLTACNNILFICLSGISQMNVHVHKAWQQGEAQMNVHIAYARYYRKPVAIYHPCVLIIAFKVIAERTDKAVLYKYVLFAFKTVHIINNVTVFQ